MNPFDIIGWLSRGMGTNAGQGILGWLGAQEQQKQRDIADAENKILEEEGRDTLRSTRLQGEQYINQGYRQNQRELDQLRESGMNMLQGQNREVNQGYDRRTQDVMAQMQQALGGLQTGYGQLGDAYGARQSGIQDRFDTGAADLNQRYTDRQANIMGQFEGLGNQAREDIGQRFGELENRGSQDLASRGLGGSTMLSGMRQGVARQREQEQRRLEESLRRERIGYQTQLSGDALANRRGLLSEGTGLQVGLSGDRLSAQERGIQGIAGQQNANAAMQGAMTGEQLAALERGNQREFSGHETYGSAQMALTNERFNRLYGNSQKAGDDKMRFLGGIRHLYPDSNWLLQLQQQLGQNAGGGAPKTDNTGAYVGAGATIGSAILIAL